MIKDIIKVNLKSNPILEKVSLPVSDINEDIKQLCKDMLATMLHNKGYGLSAIQIGVPLRVVVMDDSNPIFLINPKIVKKSDELISYKEGCLSIPKVFFRVDRPKTVTIEYLDIEGNEQTSVFTDFDSICIQHEIDHLNGVLMIDYSSSELKRKQMIKKSRKKKYI